MKGNIKLHNKLIRQCNSHGPIFSALRMIFVSWTNTKSVAFCTLVLFFKESIYAYIAYYTKTILMLHHEIQVYKLIVPWKYLYLSCYLLVMVSITDLSTVGYCLETIVNMKRPCLYIHVYKGISVILIWTRNKDGGMFKTQHPQI